MAERERLICAASDLAEQGRGVRFELESLGQPLAAFVVRFDGQPRAFLNQCGHVPVEVGPVSTNSTSALPRESDGCKARCAGKGYPLPSGATTQTRFLVATRRGGSIRAHPFVAGRLLCSHSGASRFAGCIPNRPRRRCGISANRPWTGRKANSSTTRGYT
jgi:nitrite reductase/ring-hydroxylating ferredoxin subunit